MSDSIKTTPEFTPDFSNAFSPYDKKYGFNSVIFPSNAPLLCQDLNEMQAILSDAQKMLIGHILTNGVLHEGGAGIDSDGFVLSVNGEFPTILCVDDTLIALTVSNSEKGDTLYFKNDLWLVFEEEIVDANTQIYPGTDNYLDDNDFGIELSHRKRWKLYDYSETPPETHVGRKAVKVISDREFVYSKISIDSSQGGMLSDAIVELYQGIVLAYNGFAGGEAVESVETDENGNEIEVWTECSYNPINRDILVSTKTSRLGQTDENGNEIVTEILDIEGYDYIYEKTTTFKIEEDGRETISTSYEITHK